MNKQIYEKIIHFKETENLSVIEISKKMNITTRTIYKYINNYKKLIPVEQIKNVGRPKKITDEISKYISELITNNQFITSKQISNNVFSTKNIKISPSTIRSHLNKKGMIASIPKPTPMITNEQKLKRIKWAKENIDFDFSKVIFTDETCIELGSNISLAWHEKSIKPKIKKRKINPKIMLWACISSYHKSSIHILSGKINSEKYCKFINDKFLPWQRLNRLRSYYFQQDNAPIHVSKYSRNFFLLKKIKTIDWPPCSPDLNPIENIWGILKRAVDKRKPKTKSELIKITEEEWNKIHISTIQNCINSMSKRLASVIESEGDKIKY